MFSAVPVTVPFVAFLNSFYFLITTEMLSNDNKAIFQDYDSCQWAHRRSSSLTAFSEGCNMLRSTSLNLDYPIS